LWLVDVAMPGKYDITLRFKPIPRKAVAHVELAGVKAEQPLGEQTPVVVFRGIALASGPGRLDAYLTAGKDRIGAMFVEVARQVSP
jgi:hypothetical protein